MPVAYNHTECSIREQIQICRSSYSYEPTELNKQLPNKQETEPNRGWDTAGAAGMLQAGGGCEPHCSYPPPLPSGRRVLFKGLWPTCRLTPASPQLRCPEPSASQHREQAGTMAPAPKPGLPNESPSSPATRCPGLLSTSPALASLKHDPDTEPPEVTSLHRTDCVGKAGEPQELSGTGRIL